MKKLFMYFAGIMMAFSLAACTPTQVTETLPQGGHRNPEGITPEMIAERNAAANNGVDLKQGDPDAPTYDMVFVYSVNSDATGLERSTMDVEELTEQAVVDCLVEKGVLEADTTVNSFDIEGGEKAGPGVAAGNSDGERVGILDLSKIPESDTSEETAMLNAIGNTFIENFELDKLKLLINGENYESSHTVHGDEDYLFYIDKYEKF